MLLSEDDNGSAIDICTAEDTVGPGGLTTGEVSEATAEVNGVDVVTEEVTDAELGDLVTFACLVPTDDELVMATSSVADVSFGVRPLKYIKLLEDKSS